MLVYQRVDVLEVGNTCYGSSKESNDTNSSFNVIEQTSKQAGIEQICNVSNKNQNNAHQTHIIPSNT
jgi:hypothetical protein